MLWWFRRDPFTSFDNLPDKPRLGAGLLASGLIAMLVRLSWPRLDASGYLFAGGVGCLVCGGFILFRRGVWWLQDRREKNGIRLQLK